MNSLLSLLASRIASHVEMVGRGRFAGLSVGLRVGTMGTGALVVHEQTEEAIMSTESHSPPSSI